MSKDLNKIVFVFILVLALYLRLNGIANGFPFIFHPDEPTIVRSALGVRFFPNPGHFDWPHLYIYLNYFVYMAFAKLRDILAIYNYKAVAESVFPLMWNDDLVYYLITRIMTAVFGALTVIPVYLTGKKLFGIKAGLLSALAFALIPFHIRHSHYALPDAPMVFFLAWSMYFSAKVLIKKDPVNYAGAGAYAGFAASTKYHGGLASGMVPLAHIVRIIKNKEAFLDITNILNLAISGVIAVIAFVLGTPYSVMDYKTFVRVDGPKGALWQFTNVGNAPFMERPMRFFTEMFTRIPDDLSYVFLFVYLAVLLVLAAKLITRKTLTVDLYAWFIWFYGLLLLFYISGFSRPRSHYYMIAYPFIAVIFGYFCSYVFEKLQPKLKAGVLVIYTALFILPLFYSVKEAYTFGNKDTRNILSEWLSAQPITGRFVYTTDDLDPVMNEYKDRSVKGISQLEDTRSGYLIYVEPSDSRAGTFSLLNYSSRIERTLTIASSYRNGPKIDIYKIKY